MSPWTIWFLETIMYWASMPRVHLVLMLLGIVLLATGRSWGWLGFLLTYFLGAADSTAELYTFYAANMNVMVMLHAKPFDHLYYHFVLAAFIIGYLVVRHRERTRA